MTLNEIDISGNPCIQKAQGYKQRPRKQVQCEVCERRCIIRPGNRGYCGARMNLNGQLYVLTYGDISSISANPIEKKPFHHFYPKTRALTVGGWGCNFACPWCQNWNISKQEPDPHECKYLSPEQMVDEIKRWNCQGTSFSFSEPTTVFYEYALDVMPLARNQGFYNTFVSNGYMTAESLKQLVNAGLDAINIDIKGCAVNVKKYCGIDVEKVWATARRAIASDVWVEITTLVIPGVNDTAKCLTSIAQRIHDELNSSVPWHVSAYHPAYRAKEVGLNISTSVETLEKARQIGLDAGLDFVYIGNVLGHSGEHSYCRSCGERLIRRSGYDITIEKLSPESRCQRCGTKNLFILPQIR